MKIEHRIILSNVFNVALIVLIGLFAIQNLNLMLTKLRFVEIADDLNASFLEMRLSEKNYFLYKDESALSGIKEKIEKTMESVEAVGDDISRAVGENNLNQLLAYLKNYSGIVEELRRGSRDVQLETRLRNAGRKLKEFSETMTVLEKKQVNDIIARSKKVLFSSFWAILISAIAVSHFISQRILRSLREIQRLAISISEGNFRTIEHIPSRDEFGSLMKAINFMSEELKNREEEIIQSKKLASLGVLTAGVAHELTNPLNNISMIAQTYEEVYDGLSNEQRIEFMNKVERETERIKEIVKNLLDFSKPKEVVLKEADINTAIQKTLKLVQNMLDISNVETKIVLEDSLPPVFTDEHQFQQVLVNLITNAVHAMPGGGRLFLGTRARRQRDTIEVSVMDTGKGIPPEHLPHIFDPFFSTKGEGGTGLGLSVSYGIIKHHGGTIRVESKVGVGTTFTIELPAYKKKEENNGSL
ncbi:MAG TPA: ATP-binding protein [Thermodesulfovibrionales bacterium]|nr:ATP-binding protein [Thermodesulfovibrionales bacterium]